MRDLGTGRARLAIVLAAALAIAGCSGSEQATNAADANTLDANLLLDQPANDASAMDSAVNAIEPVATNNGVENDATNASGDVLGETSGGDTGGNTVEGNISAM
jgi:hypothetical protein